LKDVSLYEQKHVGFANQAVAESADDSRICPGMQIALDAAQAFLLVMATWAPQGCKVASVWRPTKPIEPAGKPAWWKPYTLERVHEGDVGWYEELLDGDISGEDVLQDLGPTRFQAIAAKVDADRDGVPDAVNEMDWVTQLFYKASKMSWGDLSCIKTIDPPYMPALGAFSDSNSVLFEIGGIRVPRFDEQWSGMPWLKTVSLKLFKSMISFTGDEAKESLQVGTQQQLAEAIAMAQQAFLRPGGGTLLPVSKHPWTDLSLDPAQGLFAAYGPGQLFLRANTDPRLQEYGDVACDISSLGAMAVRAPFERMGAVAVFQRDSSGLLNITAIDWKHGDRVVKPSDDAAEWEHAKFVWRSSIGVCMTAVHHLTWTHWVVSNAVATSIREALGPQHPVRRALHVNIYSTASINSLTYWTLYPENGFLHHMSSFTYEALRAGFEDALAKYEFKTWPQLFEDSDLPQELKSKMPMFEDGLPLWAALRDFFAGYVGLYYKDDQEVLADKELHAYWRFHCSPQYARALPALSKDALVNQITQAVFDITAYHEFVGTMVDFTVDPRAGAMQVRPGSTMADKQQLLQALSLTAATGSPMPRYVDDWSKILDLGPDAKVNRFPEAKVLWTRLRDRLLELSAENKTRNEGRPQAWSHFDPEYLECSVSL